MLDRLAKENINTKEYFEKLYSDPNWRAEWDGADQRLHKAMELIKTHYPLHLDIGCADGTFTKLYLDKFPNTVGYGVDISEAAVELAQENCPEGHFEPADAYTLPFTDEMFDLVHSAETIEHLEEPDRALQEVHRVLKKGGVFIMTVPNEQAADYKEHLWKWDAQGVRLLIRSAMTKKHLSRFKILEEYPNFFNGHIYYVKAKKT